MATHADRVPAPAAAAAKFSFGAPSTPESAAPPAPVVDLPTPPPPPKEATPEPAAASTPSRPRRRRAPEPSGGYDYESGVGGRRVKDPGGVISQDLLEVLQEAKPQWSATHWAELKNRKLPEPTVSGFREALLRLGLKHIDDPEFIDLIPVDGRRRK